MLLYFTKIVPESGEKNTKESYNWSGSYYMDGIYNPKKDYCDVDNELTIVTRGSKVSIFYLLHAEADSYYGEDEGDRFYIRRDYDEPEFKLMRFKYKQILSHRKDYDASRVYVAHDPVKNIVPEDRYKKDFKHLKSRYYLLTQKKQADGTVKFEVKFITFDFKDEENPEPSECKIKREVSLDLNSTFFDLSKKEISDFKLCEKTD